MDLSALVAAQSSADRRRGFKLDFETDADRIAQLEQDIVGLIGEIGEFFVEFLDLSPEEISFFLKKEESFIG